MQCASNRYSGDAASADDIEEAEALRDDTLSPSSFVVECKLFQNDGSAPFHNASAFVSGSQVASPGFGGSPVRTSAM